MAAFCIHALPWPVHENDPARLGDRGALRAEAAALHQALQDFFRGIGGIGLPVEESVVRTAAHLPPERRALRVFGASDAPVAEFAPALPNVLQDVLTTRGRSPRYTRFRAGGGSPSLENWYNEATVPTSPNSEFEILLLLAGLAVLLQA